MTRKRSSPMGLEIYLPVLLAFVMLPLLTQAAPLQDYTEIQQYTEGCYYNYNHYNEGDRIMTNEPCLNCTCHNKMLMCYLRVCPFTKPIGHDCIVEKREDQCCPIVTCPEVPVDVAHASPEAGTELSFPEKFGCSIENKFYLEGAQVPSNPNRPCELCYCIKNRTSCLMQECTLHIDGCTPIYNKGSCCPVRYNCDHENDVLGLEDHSTTTTEATTTTTTVRPTTGFIIRSTMTPAVSTDCVHNNELYADGAQIASERACENCYCMRGEIVCAVRECHMPMLNDNGKLCHPMPAAEGECCPNNFVCEDDAASTLSYSDIDEENSLTTTAPVKDLHSAIPEEDLQLQTHIDEEETSTKAPSIEDEAGEKVAETDVVTKPSAGENETKEGGAEQESVTEEVENAKVTAVTSSVLKPGDVTKAPISSDAQHESSTELSVSENDKENTKTTEKDDTKYPALEGEETGTKVPTTTYELPESSTDSSNIGEKYATVTAANIKPKIEESDSTTDIVGGESVTKITPTEEDTSEETSKSPDEVVLISSEDNFTDIPTVDVITDKETKPLKSNESVTENNITVEEEKIFIDSTTLSPSDIQMSTQTFEESQSGTKMPIILGQKDKITTEAPVKLSKGEKEILGEKFDEQSSQAPTRNEGQLPTAGKPDEQEIDVTTTQAPGKVIIEEKDLTTAEPKIVRKPEEAKKEDEEEVVTILPTTIDEHELSTELTDEKDTEHSTTDSAKFLEADGITKLPDNEEHTSVTTASKVEEEETYTQNVPTTSPTNIHPMSSEGSSDAFGEVQHKDQVIAGTPSKSEEDYKPLLEEELGSGDYTTEVTSEHPSKTSTVKDVTSITLDLEEDNTTAKTITTANEKPVEQDSFTELLEESAESDEDNKLIDLTTTAPSKSITTSATAKTKDGEDLEITTIEPNLADVSTSAAEVSSTAEVSEASTEIPSEEQTNLSSTPSIETSDKDKIEEISVDAEIDITTVETLVDKKVPPVDKIISDEHKSELLGQTEVSSTPSFADEPEENKSSSKGEDKQEISEKPAELENVTTQKTIQELDIETSTASITDITTEEENNQKVLSEIGDHKVEEPTVITGSPMLIFDDNSVVTTPTTTTQADNRTEPNPKIDIEEKVELTAIQEPSFDDKINFEEVSSTTTIKPFDESSRVKEMPEMHLPSVIPGEGDCLVGQKTYANNSTVPASDECELVCRCVSSIVVCERIKCDVPENVEKCILDEISSNKCCPTYICATETLPPTSEGSFGSTDQDKDEDVRHPTTPHKVPTQETAAEAHTEKSEMTTSKPISDAFSPSVSIPEIEMPIAITEEPMSHVKSEDEFEQQTTKSPIKIAEDKEDIFIEDHSSTTPSAVVKDIVVPQSITPDKTSEQEIVNGEVSEKPESDATPAHSTDQEQLEKEIEEQMFTHGSAESTTSSAVHVPSDKKVESEVYTTTLVPTTDKYLTVKPIKEEEFVGEKTDFHSSLPSTTAGPIISSSEKTMESGTQTDKIDAVPVEFSNESKEKPHHTLPDESSHGKEPAQGSDAEIHPVSIDITNISTSTEDEISTETSTTPDKDIDFPTILTVSQETLPSLEEHSTNIADHTTTVAPIKDHDTEFGDKDTARTTTRPSIEDLEEPTTIKQQPSDKTEDHDIKITDLDEKLESTSTLASVTEKFYDHISHPPRKDYEEIVKPTKDEIYEEEIELSTVVSEAGDKTLDHTVSSIIPDKNMNASEEPIAQSSTSKTPISEYSEQSQPETQTHTATTHEYSTAHIPQENIEKDNQEEIQTATVPVSDEKMLVYTTPTSADTVTDTEKHSSIDEVSTEIPSHYITEDISTTASIDAAKSDENRESVQSYTENSKEQITEKVMQVESEKTEITPIEMITEYTTEKNIISSIEHVKKEPEPSMDHTVVPLAESEDTFTISTTLVEHEPQLVTDHSTTAPSTSDEYTSEVIDDKEDKIISIPKAEKPNESTTQLPGMETENTHVPAKQPILDLIEEASGESIESEEESSTQRIEESSSKSPTMTSTEGIEEVSSEESEESNEMHSTTKNTNLPTIEQHSKMDATTEHVEISNKNKLLTTDKIPEADISSIITKAPIPQNSQDLNAISEDVADQTTEKRIISSVTTSPLVELNPEQVTDQQTKGAQPSGTESPISLEDIKHATVQQTEVDKVIIDIDISTEKSKEEEEEVSTDLEDVSSEEPGNENILHITGAPIDASQQYDTEDTTVSEALTPTKDVTDKILHEKNILDATTAPASVEETRTVTALHSQEESVQDIIKSDEIEHVTKLPEDVETSTIKTPLIFEEIQHITDKYPTSADNDSTTEKSINEVESEEPKITSAVVPTDETSEVTTSQVPEADVQRVTEVSEKDFDVLSATNVPTEGVDLATAKPSKESEETLGVTETLDTETSTAKLPVFGDETAITEINKDQDQVNQHRISEHVTELVTLENQSEEESHEYMTEMPGSDEVPNITLTDSIEKPTELPAESADSEKDEYDQKKVADVSTEKLSEEVTVLPEEESHEEATELADDTPSLTHRLPELSENITYLPPKDVEFKEKIAEEKPTELPGSSDELTEHDKELPAKDIESNKEFDKGTTDLPFIPEISKVKLSEEDTEQQTKGTHIEDEKSVEETTELPSDDHVSTDKLPEHITKQPTKDFESEEDSHQESDELTWNAETSSEKLPAHVTELSIQSHETDAENEEMEAQDQVTQLPMDVLEPSEKLPEHITDSPSKDKDTEIASEIESAEKLLKPLNELPSKDVETQENSSEESTHKLSKLPAENVAPEEEIYEIATESPIVAHEISNSGQAIDHTTESAFKIEEPSRATSTQATDETSAVNLQPDTTAHPLFPHYTTVGSEPLDSQTEKDSSHSESVSAKDDKTFATSTTTTASTTTSEPVTTSAPHYQPQPPIYGQPPQYGPTQYEDEYTDEDEGEVFGPGTCRYGGKLYVSAQQIPRDDPCDFCFCFRSDIICLQQSCPPPISGCHEEPISGFCCPRYECPVSMATVLNITTSTTTTSTTLPPHFLHHSYGNNAKRNGCFINGRSYRVGEKIESTSGPCINCTCGGDGKMKCDPQACVPEPTMQQVMAVVAAGRKR